MKKNLFKRMIPITLALAIATPVLAETTTANENATLVAPEQESKAKYISFDGTIATINQGEHYFMVAVTGKDDNTIIYNISDTTLLLDLGTKESITRDTLETGQEVTAAYRINTPSTLSFPPQVNPEVMILRGTNDEGNVKVDHFDKNGLSSDSRLKINVSDSTTIVDYEGNTVASSEVADKNIVVFYSIETRSIPPQTPPEKIIILKNQEPPTEYMETPEEATEEVTEQTPEEQAVEESNTTEPPEEENAEAIHEAKKNLILQTRTAEQLHEKDNVKYVRLYDIATQLDYTIRWNEDAKSVFLTKGPVSYLLKIGQTEYTCNSSSGHFTNAPIIKDDRTFVEEEFITLLLR